ncbi:unnamed protein product [Caenorhabditis angaria]|uniref:Glycosyltransferase family 92 protein n=1 Tax=Caenorhabditis angaria TaxID=860376 RepID=A0A9P1IRU0_9PELO|nr:unnamed protein product [Caenorhabditis angaria]
MTRWIRPLQIQISKSSCDYTTVLLYTNVMRNMSRLEIQGSINQFSEPQSSEIKFIEPIRYVQNPVVFCINPLVAELDWRILLEQISVTKRFGAHLHIYVISMSEEFYKVLKTNIEKFSHISISLWPSIKFPQTYHPTSSDSFLQFEFRTQTASSTDCLIKFKESAQFIGTMDLQDIIIPNFEKLNYYEIFEMGYNWLQIQNSDIQFVRPEYFNITKSELNQENRYISKYIGNEQKTIIQSVNVKRLKTVSKYSQIITQCLKSLSNSECVNLFKCDLPKKDKVQCIHSDARYRSGLQMSPITFHFNQEPYFNRNYRCFL